MFGAGGTGGGERRSLWNRLLDSTFRKWGSGDPPPQNDDAVSTAGGGAIEKLGKISKDAENARRKSDGTDGGKSKKFQQHPSTVGSPTDKTGGTEKPTWVSAVIKQSDGQRSMTLGSRKGTTGDIGSDLQPVKDDLSSTDESRLVQERDSTTEPRLEERTAEARSAVGELETFLNDLTGPPSTTAREKILAKIEEVTKLLSKGDLPKELGTRLERARELFQLLDSSKETTKAEPSSTASSEAMQAVTHLENLLKNLASGNASREEVGVALATALSLVTDRSDVNADLISRVFVAQDQFNKLQTRTSRVEQQADAPSAPSEKEIVDRLVTNLKRLEKGKGSREESEMALTKALSLHGGTSDQVLKDRLDAAIQSFQASLYGTSRVDEQASLPSAPSLAETEVIRVESLVGDLVSGKGNRDEVAAALEEVQELFTKNQIKDQELLNRLQMAMIQFQSMQAQSSSSGTTKTTTPAPPPATAATAIPQAFLDAITELEEVKTPTTDSTGTALKKRVLAVIGYICENKNTLSEYQFELLMERLARVENSIPAASDSFNGVETVRKIYTEILQIKSLDRRSDGYKRAYKAIQKDIQALEWEGFNTGVFSSILPPIQSKRY